LFFQVYVVAHRISYNIFVGPRGVKLFDEFLGLGKLVAGCCEKKFAVIKLTLAK
jgi:hypothetical protein